MAINGMRLILLLISIPSLGLARAKPETPVMAIAGTSINRPGATISDFSVTMDSYDPSNSTKMVELKNRAIHNVAVIAAER